MDQLERFWSQVDKSGECWLWTGTRVSPGYGQVHFDGVRQVAHRVSWKIANGEIPEGLKVLHKCDNPPCVRPSHLFLGTQKDNAQDMSAKGRCNPRRRKVREYSGKQRASVIHYVRELGVRPRMVAAYFRMPLSHVERILADSENESPIDASR